MSGFVFDKTLGILLLISWFIFIIAVGFGIGCLLFLILKWLGIFIVFWKLGIITAILFFCFMFYKIF